MRFEDQLERYAAALNYAEGWRPEQIKAFMAWMGIATSEPPMDKVLVFFPTGKGKTAITLVMAALKGYTEAIVLCPPITHPAWKHTAKLLGIKLTPISHAKFRQKEYKLSRNVPLIVDEMHLLGGSQGAGWKKLNSIAPGMKAPVILASATPNYNDAERCYCIVHVLNPEAHRGGYPNWIRKHCITQENYFSPIPKVLGFREYKDAAAFLAAQPNVLYIPDTAPNIINNRLLVTEMPEEFDKYNYDHSKNRIMASSMEKRHRLAYLRLVDPETGLILDHVFEEMAYLAGISTGPMIYFAAHASVAEAIARSFEENEVPYGLITGKTTTKRKGEILEEFLASDEMELVGTASLATGADGLDRKVNELIIVDDTDDDAQRRQLTGRILPRGNNKSNQTKYAYRFVFDE